MASTINAITTGAGGIVTTGDSSGIIGLQSNGTTISTISLNGITYPTWTTATRPGTPSASQMGYNTSINAIEYYNGSAWVDLI